MINSFSYTMYDFFSIHLDVLNTHSIYTKLDTEGKSSFMDPRSKGRFFSPTAIVAGGTSFLIFRLGTSWLKEMSHSISALECKCVSHSQKWC